MKTNSSIVVSCKKKKVHLYSCESLRDFHERESPIRCLIYVYPVVPFHVPIICLSARKNALLSA